MRIKGDVLSDFQTKRTEIQFEEQNEVNKGFCEKVSTDKYEFGVRGK